MNDVSIIFFEWNSKYQIFNKTPLIIAVEKNNFEAVQLLLGEENIDVNIKSILNNFFLMQFRKQFFINIVLNKFYLFIKFKIIYFFNQITNYIIFIRFFLNFLNKVPTSKFFYSISNNNLFNDVLNPLFSSSNFKLIVLLIQFQNHSFIKFQINFFLNIISIPLFLM